MGWHHLLQETKEGISVSSVCKPFMTNFYDAFSKYLFSIYFGPDTGPDAGHEQKKKEQGSLINK